MTADPNITTIREALRILYSYTSDAANPPGAGRSSTWEEGRQAADAVARELADLRASREMWKNTAKWLRGKRNDLCAENERKAKELHASRENCYALDASRREAERLLRVTTDALRREWWLNHGHDYASLYGDDGEMQCSRCRADFKRDPIEKLREVVHAARLERTALAAVEGTAAEPMAGLRDVYDNVLPGLQDFIAKHGRLPIDLAEMTKGPAEGTAATPGEDDDCDNCDGCPKCSVYRAAVSAEPRETTT